MRESSIRLQCHQMGVAGPAATWQGGGAGAGQSAPSLATGPFDSLVLCVGCTPQVRYWHAMSQAQGGLGLCGPWLLAWKT